jgi:hypothetical protein
MLDAASGRIYNFTLKCFWSLLQIASKPSRDIHWAAPLWPCLGSIAIHDIRCTIVAPFIKDCLTEAILVIPHMNHAANVSLDTKRIITCYRRPNWSLAPMTYMVPL